MEPTSPPCNSLQLRLPANIELPIVTIKDADKVLTYLRGCVYALP